ncbi:MAG: hypothetical protein HOA17_02330 [Candidatus Melainabacteria bacterium]|nr:hypothetical protein [Candidatus Melainabacteria bacterium]
MSIVKPYFDSLNHISERLDGLIEGLSELRVGDERGTMGNLMVHYQGQWAGWQECLPPAQDLVLDFALHQGKPELLIKVLEILNQVFRVDLDQPSTAGRQANVIARANFMGAIFDRLGEVYISICRGSSELRESFEAWMKNLVIDNEHKDLREEMVTAINTRNRRMLQFVPLNLDTNG